jgi:hypothetical protein
MDTASYGYTDASTDKSASTEAPNDIFKQAKDAIDGEEWPEPEPLRAPLPEAEPCPVDQLGDVLGGAVTTLHECVKAPLALCAQSALAAASFVTQAYFDAEMPWGETRPLSLSMPLHCSPMKADC